MIVGDRCVLAGKYDELVLRIEDGEIDSLPPSGTRRNAIRSAGHIDVDTEAGVVRVRSATGWTPSSTLLRIEDAQPVDDDGGAWEAAAELGEGVGIHTDFHVHTWV